MVIGACENDIVDIRASIKNITNGERTQNI